MKLPSLQWILRAPVPGSETAGVNIYQTKNNLWMSNFEKITQDTTQYLKLNSLITSCSEAKDETFI